MNKWLVFLKNICLIICRDSNTLSSIKLVVHLGFLVLVNELFSRNKTKIVKVKRRLRK